MRNAKRSSLVSILVFSLLLPAIFAMAPQPAFGIMLLHEFAGGADDGGCPIYGSLTLSGFTLYGMTLHGGDNNWGVVFKVNTDGTGYDILHEFTGGADDGSWSNGSLTLSGSTLYGMTYNGGDDSRGVVFKVNTDGTGYGHLHEFAGGANDGHYPYGSLTLSGSTLYGMTSAGGDDNVGVVFKVNTDGSGYGHLHEFAGGTDDGASPLGSLTLSGSTLYGMTYNGGDDSRGVVFKVNTNGSGFDLLHEFTGYPYDGRNPSGSLVLSGSTLYGMTSIGGDDNVGVVFKVNTDGSGYGHLHEFAGSPNDGRNPYGSLVFSGVSPSTLYGMTHYGGDNDRGVVFEIGTDGSYYGHLHEFAGGANDGHYPYGSLTLSGSTLYGMTSAGGDNNSGVIFALEIPEPGTLLLLAPALLGFAGLLRRWLR